MLALRASGQPLNMVERTQADGQTLCIAFGSEHREVLSAQSEGVSYTWTERRLLVQSRAAAQAAELGLRTRLSQAQAALSALMVRRQGKPVLSDQATVDQAVADMIVHFRVERLLVVTVSKQAIEQSVRAYRTRPATMTKRSPVHHRQRGGTRSPGEGH